MAKSKKKSTPPETTTDQSYPDLKANSLSESTEQKPLSENQIDSMLDTIDNGGLNAADRVESDQIPDDSAAPEAESGSETTESSNESASAVEAVVQESIEEIDNETLQEMSDDQPTSAELESKSDTEASDDSGHLESSMGEASEVMNDLDLNVESESNSINQDSVEEIDNENLQNPSNEGHAFVGSQLTLDANMTDNNNDLNHLDSDRGEAHQAIDESKIKMESESHLQIHDSNDGIEPEASLKSPKHGQVSDKLEADFEQNDSDEAGVAKLAAKEVHEAMSVSNDDDENSAVGIFDKDGSEANMTDDSQLLSEDSDDQSVVMHDQIRSASNSDTQDGLYESTENEIVDLIENSVDQIDDTKKFEQHVDKRFESEPAQLDPDEDLLESSDSENDATQLLSAYDSEQNDNPVSTAKPRPIEPLEQNHTNDEALTVVDKTQSDSQDAQPERTIVSDPVHSTLEPKSHARKVNYLLVSGLALIAIVMAAVLGVYSFTLQSEINDMEVMLASFEDNMELISARIDRPSATDEKIRRINVRLDRLVSKITSIETSVMAKETSIENNEKPAKQHEILSGRIEREPKRGNQSGGFGNVKTGEKPSKNKQSALQINKKQSQRSNSSVLNNVGTPKSPALNSEWSVNLISLSSKSSVEKLKTDFQKLDVVTKIKAVKIDGKQWYRLQVAGFSSKQEATAYAVQLEKKLALNKVWISHE